ncbi:MAG: hypothetical protein QCI00_09810 [Candidatus Thermoplasmatota archaeon]|nr:hypothetical protein [Candidatus Thermoplasmatota archaeon]
MQCKIRKHILFALIILIIFSITICSGCSSSAENTTYKTQHNNDVEPEENESSNDQNNGEYIKIPPLNEEISGLPLIQPIGNSITDTRLFPTKFGDEEYSIEIDVNRSVYLGAQKVNKKWPDDNLWYDEKLVVEYYSAFINDPEMDKFIDELLIPFERIKRTEKLNDGEFLELMITFVQQIPYDNYAPTYPRYPVEVIHDEKGDCDEKSLLLLGMLSHEGYDIALILFPDEHHATAGIRINPSGNPQFRVFESPDKAKYFYIETTVPTFIGLYSEEYEHTSYVVIPIGEGGKRFDRVNYICYITDRYTKIGDRLQFMNDQMDEWDSEIGELEWQLQYGTYDTQDEWNNDYNRYLRLINNYNNYVEKVEKYLDVYVYIEEHPHDIAGVYRRIENSKVMEIRI